MARQVINTGSAIADRTGDNGRVAFTKVNDNFEILFGDRELTQAEQDAGLTDNDINGSYPPGDIRRYGTNTTPGVTDMSTAIQAAIDQAKAGGAPAVIPPGTYACKNIRLENGTYPWALIGAGKRLTTLVHIDGDGTLLVDNGDGDSDIGYTLQGFTIDCQHSVYNHADARNGISAIYRSNITLRDIKITDYKLSAALIYDDDDDGGTYGDCAIIDCECDGLGVAVNGFLYANMDRCAYSRVTAKNLVTTADGPGVGIQFKNRCRFGRASDLYAENCVVGVGLAGDTSGLVPASEGCALTNIVVLDCLASLTVGNAASYNAVSNVYIDKGSDTTSDAVRIEGNAIGNTIDNVVVRNLGAAKRAVFIGTGCTDNVVRIARLDNIDTTGAVAVFEDGAQYNTVSLGRMTNPRMRSGGIQGMCTWTTPSDSNSFTYDNIPYTEVRTIASGVIALKNYVQHQCIIVDTESGASTDDLDTISNPFPYHGQIIVLFSTNDGRDVVVKASTHLRTASGSDVTLGTRRSSIAFMWHQAQNSWVELHNAALA